MDKFALHSHLHIFLRYLLTSFLTFSTLVITTISLSLSTQFSVSLPLSDIGGKLLASVIYRCSLLER